MINKLKNLVSMFKDEITVYRSIMADSRCPPASRWLLGITTAYALSPVDLIPDFIPVIGHLDDMIILPMLVWMAVHTIPKELVLEHKMMLKKKATEGDKS